MKNRFFLAVVFAISTITSCQKQENDLPETLSESLDYSVIDQVTSLKSLKEVKVAYGLLSNRERSVLWQNHLDEYINIGLTAKQETMILAVKNELTSDAFGKNNAELGHFMQEWLMEAKDLFSRELVSKMLGSPVPARSDSDADNPPGRESDCNCKSKNSVFTLCGGIWNASEEYNEGRECKWIAFCGVLFLEDCDGICVDY